MIFTAILNLLVNIVNVIMALFPDASKLPTIAGYDIDTALQNASGQFHYFMTVVWPIGVLFQGFLVLMAYYLLKMIVRLFLGSRIPGQ